MSDVGARVLARLDAMAVWVDTIPDWHCTDSARGEGWGSRGDCPLCDAYMFDGTEVATEDAAWEHLEWVHDRSRVLRIVAAMRAVVELHSPHWIWPGDPNPTCSTCVSDHSGMRDEWEPDAYPCPTLTALASIWPDDEPAEPPESHRNGPRSAEPGSEVPQ